MSSFRSLNILITAIFEVLVLFSCLVFLRAYDRKGMWFYWKHSVLALTGCVFALVSRYLGLG